MSPTHDNSEGKTPVVERPPPGQRSSEVGAQALEMRLHQQELLAKLGMLALQGTTLKELLTRATHLVAEGLEADFCKVMEYLPDENQLVVRAGVGWGRDVIGSATVGADLASPAGYALHTGKPVISNHLENENRFRTPDLLMRYGIRRAINVILQGDTAPFGVLEVDSRSQGEFTQHDLAFLQGAANILGMAIARQRIERDLMAAVDTQKALFDELNHRIKNSLQLAASMLQLQAATADDEGLRHQLNEASSRIVTIARAHDGLYAGSKVERVDLGAYLRGLCRTLNGGVFDCDIVVEAPEGIDVKTDRAIPLALIVNELITNAAKYAYPNGQKCTISVRIEIADGDLIIAVRDTGVGVPDGFDMAASRGLGMRIVRAFAQQLKATLEIVRHDPGTEFVVRLPRGSAQ